MVNSDLTVYRSRTDKENAEEEPPELDFEDHVIQMPWVPPVEPTELEILARTQMRKEQGERLKEIL